MGVPAIEVRELTRDYGRMRAVDHISFAVQPGEVFGFLGPNGAGKTTTVRMLTTLLEPTSGTALINGYDVVKQGYQARLQFGVVPEESNVYRELTGRQNLLFAAQLYRVPKAEREPRVLELVHQFALDNVYNNVVDTYSRGMRRKLTICMALMHRPAILFLDEPTAGLDVRGQLSIVEFIRQLSAEEMTIFLTTHQIEEANQLCDRVAIINGGRIAAIDTPEKLKQAVDSAQSVQVQFDPCPDDVEQALGALPGVTAVTRNAGDWRAYADNPGTLVPAIMAYAEARHTSVVSLNTVVPSLEDVFVQLTAKTALNDSKPGRIEPSGNGASPAGGKAQ